MVPQDKKGWETLVYTITITLKLGAVLLVKLNGIFCAKPWALHKWVGEGEYMCACAPAHSPLDTCGERQFSYHRFLLCLALFLFD